MAEETYSPYKLAIELGFSETLARHYDERGTNATNLRKIAIAMDLPSTKPTIASPPPEVDADGQPVPPKPEQHRHSYRKDGTCRCGWVRKAKRS